MSASGKTVYRVRQVVAHDVAIISEVKDGEAHSGKIKETRDSRIALGGTDSFWAVAGEKKEQKLVVQDALVPVLATSLSPVSSRIRASAVFELPKIVNDHAAPGKFDAVSFASATKLTVGYSPQDGAREDVLAALLHGTLSIPLEHAVSAIEIRPNLWLKSGFYHLPSGKYGLDQPSLRSVKTVKLDQRAEMLRLAHGLVVFTSQPKWSEPECSDLRPEEEILQAAERWLSRIQTATDLKGLAGTATPAELLRMLAESAVSDEEKADLAAVAAILSKRSELFDVLPEILGRQPAFKEMIAGFEKTEKARLHKELEDRLKTDTAAETAKLAGLRGEIADAEARLAAFSHREVLLKSETEKHDDLIRRRIEDAADAVKGEAVRETARIREDFGRLQEEFAQMKSVAPSATVADVVEPPQQADVPPPAVASLPIATVEQRQKTVSDLSGTTGLTASEVGAVIATFTEALPVIVGPGAATAAVDIASAISGEETAVVFCDPTKISLSDIIRDEHSGLQAAIEKARSHPEGLVAAALCGITAGPCEYWLPQLLEMRRIGRFPRNLALIASAGTDGIRVSIPNSALRHLFPLVIKKTTRPRSAKFEGFWPMVGGPEPERHREAIDCLLERGLEGAALQSAARALARTPSWTKVADLADIFVGQAKWLAVTAGDGDHEYNKYFKNIEG
jgi:hypothetical protein